MLPLPRSAALMMLEHQARSLHTGPRSFVFATASGRALGQRNALRALYTAQERARDEDGRPTFPELFEQDDRGDLVVDDRAEYVPSALPRRELPPLPDLTALWETVAASDGTTDDGVVLNRLAAAEAELSAYRRSLHERLDDATSELIARYRDEPALALRALPVKGGHPVA